VSENTYYSSRYLEKNTLMEVFGRKLFLVVTFRMSKFKILNTFENNRENPRKNTNIFEHFNIMRVGRFDKFSQIF